VGSLEALATEAEGAGQRLEAVEWWRKAAAAAPHNSRVALGLMSALAAAGDRAGALRWASIHRELLGDELGIEPDPGVAELEARLREGRGAGSDERPPPDGEAGVPLPNGITATSEPALGKTPQAADQAQGEGFDPRNPTPAAADPVGAGRGRRAWRWAPALAVLVLGAAFVLTGERDAESLTAVVEGLDPNLVAAVPFRTAGADTDLDFLSQGAVELLAAKLAGGGVLRAVDPAVALAAWGDAEAGGSPASRADALAVARSVGAAHALIGSVVGTLSSLTLHAALLDAATGATLAEATAGGNWDSVHDVVDALVAQLLVRHAGEGEHRLAHLTTTSPPALHAFLLGRAAHRAGQYEDALRHYGQALDLDSTFALAGMATLAVTGWVGGTAALASRARAVVSANADRLSERDRVALRGRLEPRPPDRMPSLVERLAATEEALRRWPDHPLLWYSVGDDLMHFGEALELPSWERRAREAFRRAMELDPDYSEPVHHLAVVLAETGDTAALRALVEDQIARTSVGPVADHLRWRAHHALGAASPVRPPPLEAMDTDATLRWIGVEAQDYGFALDEGARAVELRLSRPGIRDEHLERRRGAFAYAINQGHPGRALERLESIREIQPDVGRHLTLAVLTALYADGDEGAAERAARELAVRLAGSTASDTDPLAELGRCILSQWRLAREVPAGRPLDTVELPRLVAPTEVGNLASRRVICSAVTHAQYEAVRTGRADGPATVHLDSLLALGRVGGLIDDGHTEFAHIALARLREAAGDPEGALRALRRRVRYNGWQPYLATSLREEGRLAAALGDVEGALRAWDHYLAFRTDPEPALREQVEGIREAAERLRDRCVPCRAVPYRRSPTG
jgi:tetratricopeptide (TPR) repeat protein